MRNRVYFISDIHLGWGPKGKERGRQDRLIAFLKAIREDAEALYILGDLFDFWFEYRSVVPKAGIRVLFALHDLVRQGIPVACLPGNHDLWLGQFLSSEIGMSILPGRTVVRHQGLRICLDHGDDVLGGARYRLLKGILNNGISIAGFRLLHPDLGAWVARKVSNRPELDFRAGEGSGGGRGSLIEAYRQEANRRFGTEAEVVLFGHLHRPVLQREEGGTFAVLGDWIRHFTYAVLEGGALEIRKWEGLQEP